MLTSKKIRLVLLSAGIVICLSLVIPLLRAAPDPPSGTISGRVTRDGGVPAAGVTVTAFPAVRPFFRYMKDNPNTAVTDADGWYTILLRPLHPTFISGPILPDAKGYSVFVSDGGQAYIEPPAQTADPEAQPNHIVKGLDFLLRLGPQVTVYARDAITGAPDPGLPIESVDQVGRHTAMGVTGADGILRFRVPLTEFSVSMDLPGTREAAPGYGIGSRFSRPLQASPGQEVVCDLKTYSTGVHISSTGARSYGSDPDCDWHGTILGPDGRPAGGVRVTILRAANLGGATTLLTDRRGRFSALLPRLRYEESASENGPSLPAVVAQNGDLSAMETVTPDESWDGMTLRLKHGASLSGRLTDPQGRAAAGVTVALAGTVSGRDWTAAPIAITDGQGRFTIDGLPEGDYQIRTRGGNYGGLVLPTPSSNTPAFGPYLTLAAGQRLDLGHHTVLRADQELTGQVVDTQGHPIPSLYIGVTGAHTHETVVTQRDGTFHAYRLVLETLTVTVGGPGQGVTARTTPGQKPVRLVVPPDVVATDSLPPRSAPPAKPPPNSPPEITPIATQIRLDGLSLVIQPGSGGAFTATVSQQGPLSLLSGAGSCSFIGEMAAGQSLWTGTLTDVEGMRLTVRHGQGSLTDEKGNTLWSGPVWTPPTYTVVTEKAAAHGPAHATVIDAQGKTLWSGAVTSEAHSPTTQDGDLRIIGVAHDVAWERPIGSDGVAFLEGDPRDLLSRIGPWDGIITLHLGAATATLRSSDGHFLSSAPTQVVTAETTFPAPPARTGKDGKRTPAFRTWAIHHYVTSPSPVTPLGGVQNAPAGATLTLTDSAGRPLDYKRSFP